MIVFIVSFIVFTLEAFIHYNIGKTSKVTLDFEIPTFKEFLHIIGVVAIFSFINSVVIRGVSGPIRRWAHMPTK